MKPVAILLILAAFAVSACNTVKGVGRDVSTAGDAVTDQAQKTQNDL